MPFSYLYRRGDKEGEGLAGRWKALGIVAIKTELERQGFFSPVKTGTFNPIFGPNLEKAVSTFQSANQLLPDGIVGIRTLTALTKQAVEKAEDVFDIPNGWLRGIVTAESHNDPGAFYDNGPSIDRGMAMLNSKSYPELTDEQCADVRFSAEVAGKRLRSGYGRFTNPRHGKPWPLAVSYYHSPSMAMDWERFGLANMPERGDMTGEERAVHIKNYVERARGMRDGIPK